MAVSGSSETLESIHLTTQHPNVEGRVPNLTYSELAVA
jgi:hypothetical protein